MNGLQIAERIGWKRGIANVLNVISVNYMNKADYTKAMEYASRAMKINYELGDHISIAANLGNLANIYEAQGDLPKALDLQFQALKIAEQSGAISVGNSLMNIGIIYTTMGDYKKALEYELKALEQFERMSDDQGIARCYSNIGSCYQLQKQYVKALDYYEKAVEMQHESGDLFSEQISIGNIGEIFKDQKDYNRSLEYYFKALKMSEEMGDKEGIATMKGAIGCVFLEILEEENMVIKPDEIIPENKSAILQKSIVYLEQGKLMAIESSSLMVLSQIYYHLNEAYNMAGNLNEALKNHENYIIIKDSLLSIDDKIKIANLETQRETDLKNNQIEVNKVQGIKERNERILFVSCIGLFIMLIIIICKSNRKLKIVNKKLEDEKGKSENLTRELKDSVKQEQDLAITLANEVQIKSRFLENVSHEFRTPVTLLTGMLGIMKERKSQRSPEEIKQMTIAFNSSMKLQRVVEEILDLTKLESRGTYILRNEVKEISAILDPIVELFMPVVKKQNLTLHYEDGAKRLFALIDVDRFEKIVNNLIMNAIKYNTKNGTIHITTGISDNSKNIAISISDTGLGIGEEDMEHIFDRYFQGKATRDIAGSRGIGLSLVKEFTLLLGGTIKVRSKPGEGTNFIVQFPLTNPIGEGLEPDSDDHILISDGDWDGIGNENLVLVVEDNDEMRYYLSNILADKVKLAEAVNGKEALIWLENNTPDLIISDVLMPEMDGHKFISKLKSNERLSKIPVITLSAISDRENQIGMLRMGVDDYIVKPFNATELKIRVYNLLKNYNVRNKFVEQAVEPEGVQVNNIEAEEFRLKITSFVLARLKNTNVGVNELAYELSMSERQLYRFAKTLTGYTPAQLIKEVRLQKAYELLVTKQVNKIDDLSKRVGFENAGYFSRQFLERFGKRPSEFL